MLKLKTIKKHRKQLLFTVPMFVLFLVSIVLFASATEYTDPVDDLRCFTQDDLESLQDYWGEGEYPEHPNNFAEGVLELWKTGTMSATPDYIDMTLIIIEEVGTNIKLTIQVQGTFTECQYAMFLIWGNCSGGEYVAVVFIGAGEGGYSAYYKYMNEDGTTSQGQAHLDIDSVDFSYPKPNEEDCQLMILGIAPDESGMLLCMDIFPNSLYEVIPGTGGEGGGSYIGFDPTTNFLDDVASIMFGYMCGRVAFFTLLSIMLVGFKVMMDRKHPWIRAGGGIGLAFCGWLDIVYMLNINMLEKDPIFGDFSLISTLDMITAIFFVVYICFQYLNNFNYSDDNTWTYAIAYVMMIIEAALFLTPWWFYSCAGQPTLTIVVLIIMVTASFIVFGLTEKYSAGRLM